MRLYIDEDAMHHGLLSALRARHVDVLTVFEAGLTGQSDETQLRFAAEQGRVLYSFNVGDFCRLHAEFLHSDRSHAGLIVVPRQRCPVGEQARRLLQIVQANRAEGFVNHLVFM